MKRAVEGILLVDKIEGPTSHDIVGMVRRTLGIRRVGHAGTLDPFATGLLIVLISRATRLSRFFMRSKKRYVGEIVLGVETDTFDREGRIVSSNGSRLDINEVRKSSLSLVGSIEQKPPMASAIKIKGKKLYDLARKGESIDEIPSRTVTVYSFELSNLIDDGPNQKISFDLKCSAGTYVRSVARDLGEMLGVGAHLSKLRRMSSGAFSVDGAIRSDNLEPSDEITDRIVPMAEAVAKVMPQVKIYGHCVELLLNGQRVSGDGVEGGVVPEGEFSAVDEGGSLIGIYDGDGISGKPIAVFPFIID